MFCLKPLFVSQDERGRGIPIMLVWTDRVIYNKRGNEVMLIKKDPLRLIFEERSST